MAVVYRCDRCKLIYEDKDALTDVVVPGAAERDPGGPGTPKMIEAVDTITRGLCLDCLAKLRDFIVAG